MNESREFLDAGYVGDFCESLLYLHDTNGPWPDSKPFAGGYAGVPGQKEWVSAITVSLSRMVICLFTLSLSQAWAMIFLGLYQLLFMAQPSLTLKLVQVLFLIRWIFSVASHG